MYVILCTRSDGAEPARPCAYSQGGFAAKLDLRCYAKRAHALSRIYSYQFSLDNFEPGAELLRYANEAETAVEFIRIDGGDSAASRLWSLLGYAPTAVPRIDCTYELVRVKRLSDGSAAPATDAAATPASSLDPDLLAASVQPVERLMEELRGRFDGKKRSHSD